MATKQLTIQTGVIKRLQKDLSLYVNENHDQRVKIQEMKDENQEPADIRQQERVLTDIIQMIPNTRKRLEEAIEKMQTLLKDPLIQDTSEQTNAIEVLSIAENYLKDLNHE